MEDMGRQISWRVSHNLKGVRELTYRVGMYVKTSGGQEPNVFWFAFALRLMNRPEEPGFCRFVAEFGRKRPGPPISGQRCTGARNPRFHSLGHQLIPFLEDLRPRRLGAALNTGERASFSRHRTGSPNPQLFRSSHTQ